MASGPPSSSVENETNEASGCHKLFDKREDASEINDGFNISPVQGYSDVNRYHGNDDLEKAKLAVTCRLSVIGITGECVRTGTGKMIHVDKFTEKGNRNCQCHECRRPGIHTPKEAWCEVFIVIALSIVNNDESERIEFQFIELPGTDINNIPTLNAQKIVSIDDKGEWCQILCVTHDMELADRLYKVCRNCRVQMKKAGDRHELYVTWTSSLTAFHEDVKNDDECIIALPGNQDSRVSGTPEICVHTNLVLCHKNPGHLNFIGVKDFNINHLPSRYRDDLLVDYVLAASDLTCRLSVSRISKDRFETWPDNDHPFPFFLFKGQNFTMTGTGLVYYVDIFKKEDNIDCRCIDCSRPGTHTPQKMWGEIYVTTACHVVYDSEEARHTKCQFFYDSHETNINKVPTLTGGKVVSSSLQYDTCDMIYVTHDIELLDRLYKMRSRWYYLCRMVFNKYNRYVGLSMPGVECDTNVDHDLCIIVSHPHGCSKEVTVGAWKHRHIVAGNVQKSEICSYSYNTPTCPSSSGAAVITLLDNQEGIYWFFKYPVHSQGRPGNYNNSGAAKEWVAHRSSN